MPRGLERWQGGHDLHFITFSCYRRQPRSSNRLHRELFLKVLEEVRRRYQLVVIGYVVMPGHVHLLVTEPQQRPLATAIQALKLGFSRRLLAEDRRLHPTAATTNRAAFGMVLRAAGNTSPARGTAQLSPALQRWVGNQNWSRSRQGRHGQPNTNLGSYSNPDFWNSVMNSCSKLHFL